MRNLKRVLSLALALVMMLSLMIVGAGAAESTKDFTDADEIQNIEAVNVLTLLNVINGKDNGSFDPNGNVTRAEMAKMICVVLNGGQDPLLGNEANTMFTDTVNHWAKAYVAYSSNLGIVAGRGNGIFDPDANVTGTEAAKMLLVALGYDAQVFGLTGAEWATTTEVIANDIELFNGMRGTNLSAPLSRDGAAQMIYNALNAYVMERSYDRVINDGTVSYRYVLSEYKTLLNDTYGAWRVEGVVWGNEYSDLVGGHTRAGETELFITNLDELRTGSSTRALAINYDNDGQTFNTFKVSTGHDELGKTIVLYVKPAQTSAATDKATVIGCIMGENTVFVKDKEYAGNTPQKDLETDLKNAGLKTTMPNEFFVNGMFRYTDSNSNGQYNNGEAFVSYTYDAVDQNGQSVNKNGYVTQFIDNNGDGYIDFVLVDKVDLGKVTVYNTAGRGSITVSTGETTKPNKAYSDSADVVGFEDVARNDIVLWAEVGGRLYVEKADSVTGNLTDYSKQKNDEPAKASVWVDKTKYIISGATFYNDDKLADPETYAKAGDGTNLDKEATFYLDACGYVAAIAGTSVNRYALVTYWNSGAYNEGMITTSARAQVYFEDGTAGTPVISADTQTALGLSVALPEKTDVASKAVLGSYTYNSKNQLDLTRAPLAADNTLAFEYTSGNILPKHGDGNLADENGDNVYMTDSTVVFFVLAEDTLNGKVDKVTTYVGKDNVPSLKLAAGSYEVKYAIDGKRNIEAMAVISASLNGASDKYLYVISVDSTASKTRDVQVVIDGEIKNITVNRVSNGDKLNTGIHEYVIEENGNYKLTEVAATKYVAQTPIEKVNTNDRTVVVDGKEYKVNDKTQIAVLDTKPKQVVPLESLHAGDEAIVYYDGSTALGIYVVKSHDPSDLNLNRISTNSSAVKSAKKLASGDTGYDDGIDFEVVASGDSLTVGQLKAALVKSSDAVVKVYATAPADTPDRTIENVATGDALADSAVLTNGTYAVRLIVPYADLDNLAADDYKDYLVLVSVGGTKILTGTVTADQIADAFEVCPNVTVETLPAGTTEVGADQSLTLTADNSDKTVKLDGGTLVLDMESGTLPKIEGKGNVEFKQDAGNGSGLGALVTAGLSKTAEANSTAGNTANVAPVDVERSEVTVSGEGCAKNFNSAQDLDTYLATAEAEGSGENLSFYTFSLNDLQNEGEATYTTVVTGVKYVGETSIKLTDALNPDGEGKRVEAQWTGLDATLLLGDKVDKVVFTVTKTPTDGDAITYTITFNIK